MNSMISKEPEYKTAPSFSDVTTASDEKHIAKAHYESSGRRGAQKTGNNVHRYSLLQYVAHCEMYHNLPPYSVEYHFTR